MIAAIILILLGSYLALGLLFALPFVFRGVQTLDPHAAHATWGFRLLILPGSIALWPLLLQRWLRGIRQPPEEVTAHRRLAAAEPHRRP